MNEEVYDLYLVGKPESRPYMSRRGGPSINDKSIYNLVNEFNKKGIKVDLKNSMAGYVEPVSRDNAKERRGECCIANDKDLKEKYVFLKYLLKAEELEIFLEDVFENGVEEGIHCCFSFKNACESRKEIILNDVRDVLTRFYGFECKDSK